MKLRNITFISIAALTLVFVAIESWVSQSVVKQGFDTLEREFAVADARRVRNEVLREIEALGTFVWDWSSWDDTYDFARTGNPEYIESNLPIETFDNQSLNAIIITDTQGRLVFGRALDTERNDDTPMLERLMAAVMERPANGQGEIKGLLAVPEGILFFARRDILNSQDLGPPAGRMLMARLLTEETRQAIAERLELPVEFFPVADGDTGLAPVTLESLTHGDGLFVEEQDADIINGYALLRDADGQPALVVKAVRERSISRQGRSVANLNFMILAAVLVAFSLLVFYLLQSKVLSRMERLNAEVKTLNGSGEVTVQGRDEIAELSRNINAMLHQIDESRTALQTAHDDLERKVRERTAELEKANRELQWLDQAKSHFLSSTSHELRTPLTSILGFVKLMERTFKETFEPSLAASAEPPEKIAKHLQNYKIVRAEAERLSRLINDLLDFSKISAGKVDWHEDEVTPAELVRDAGEAIAGQLGENPQVELTTDVAPDLPTLRVSRDRIHQVLINLLGNAARHTESGYIRIAARRSGDAIEFSVSDTGVGVLLEDRERIFEVFYQSTGEYRDAGRSAGTGLGLAICKEIVEHYGGRIRVESEPGKGSVFSFSLPISRPISLTVQA
ncbi:CHASE4 domain-containing protein [Pseudodesulfovibrio aespoeensis]|uniref:sensor histidine kinase n=1 Tax=Pseudodesulfovibrio aespoeensis TaxID=182210 RepID=UPI002353F8AE|nr:CHASE4 domain-containing protein [Pseudodesulfovibrio aespoeensis]MCG2732556.1 ATP-binding protein [Pseudodesulfovibrio aespoeensis]